ncbi:hypothetical protein cyc_04349 [Cyclospora cayetanensis]|uniref:Uncharacterized protein n=1 Tax=Cyclospora cayetanensis TaxID=88456 RepID=A0A1D3D1H9_9EIME|nr:hypothetical protein cyc_04349 [Cyclospora cayetanensis]
MLVAPEHDQTATFSTLWIGPSAIISQPNALLVCARWMGHKSNRLLMKFQCSSNYSLTRSAGTGSLLRLRIYKNAKNVLSCKSIDSETHIRREALVKSGGKRQAQWLTAEQLWAALPVGDFGALF